MSTEMQKKVFARNLKYYMEKHGMSQKEVSEVVGVSAPTVNDWLMERKYPRIDKVQKLADYFGILKSDLMEDKMPASVKEQNDRIAAVVLKIAGRPDAISVIEKVADLNNEQLEAIAKLLSMF